MRRGLTIWKIREQHRAYRAYHKRRKKPGVKQNKVERMIQLTQKITSAGWKQRLRVCRELRMQNRASD